jgi:hypothetical protein
VTDQPDDTEVNPTVRNAIPKGFSARGGDAGAGPDAGGQEPDDSGQRHSALVGFMSVPVHPRLPIRRSTLLMVVAFVGFGTLWYLYPPASSGAASGSGGSGAVCLAPGLCRGSTNVTPAPTPTTTTTSPPAPTSTTVATPTTTRPSTSTTTRPSTSTTTTTSSPSPTTTGTSLPGAGVGGTGQTTTTTLSGSAGASGTTTTSTTR